MPTTRKPRKPRAAGGKKIAALKHGEQTRPNNPTAEMQGLVGQDENQPQPVQYPRNPDLDPQLMWQGKDDENQRRLHIDAVPIYVQEKIHPEVIIRNLRDSAAQKQPRAGDLFAADFGGAADENAQIEFYRHRQKWTNRLILGDSLMVMASLAHKEGLKGKVQCIYLDPPYGIKFASNWQTSTKSTTVTDRDETREPEMIQAFRDTWKNGIHSYLSYLRDRLTVARDLLTESGSVFVQISDENVHLVRSLLDEIYGSKNFVSQIVMKRASVMFSKKLLNSNVFYLLLYAKNIDQIKYNSLYVEQSLRDFSDTAASHLWFYDSQNNESQSTREQRSQLEKYVSDHSLSVFQTLGINAQGTEKQEAVNFQDKLFYPPAGTQWKTSYKGMDTLAKAGRLLIESKSLRYKYYHNDYPVNRLGNYWEKIGAAGDKVYVVQTNKLIAQRCILMTTDPGDLVLDPTCGSGTTATVAEQWGRRWITIDTSRVALAITRARLMGSKYDYYLLQDSEAGAQKETELTRIPAAKQQFTNDVRHGFVYERVPHITLGDIANNTEIDAIHEKWQQTLQPLQQAFNEAIGKKHEEWQIPPEKPADAKWSANAIKAHDQWRNARRQRQQEIDASIAANAKTELLVDKPHTDSRKIRVTGPFTVESLSPHRILPTDEADEILLAAADAEAEQTGEAAPKRESRRLRPKTQTDSEAQFINVIYDNLKTAGVQNTRKKERLEFSEITPWANSRIIQFAGHYDENGKHKKAAISIGPEYGTVTRQMLISAAREAADMFDMLIIMGFAFEAHADDKLAKLGNLPVLRVRLNNDLHMAHRLKEQSNSNLFVVFGEPDIEMRRVDNGDLIVEIKGIDIFDPTTGEVRPSDVKDIACWMIDTDYNEESFFARHIYFTGGGKDPYKQLKAALRAEIDQDEWAKLYSPTSTPFPPPTTGKIAVKAINHYGDEVIKIFETD